MTVDSLIHLLSRPSIDRGSEVRIYPQNDEDSDRRVVGIDPYEDVVILVTEEV